MVTDYPMKVVKAKQRHDFSTVCVVEISGSQGISQQSRYDSRFLLVKRPAEGLLAGLWEFPSITLDEEADLSKRRKLIDQLLKKSFRLNPPKNCSIISRELIGEFVHVFSHIRRKIYVELLVLHLKGLRLPISFSQTDNTSLLYIYLDMIIILCFKVFFFFLFTCFLAVSVTILCFLPVGM